jgi:SH3-like domain-containing protein
LSVLLVLFFFATFAQAGDPVCAKSAITLRKTPGLKSPISWRVPRYMPFMRVDRKSGWSKVQDLEGEEHWAKNSDLSTQIRCVVVKTNVATLRKEPNPSAAPIEMKTVDRYTPFKRLGNDREWVQVEDETGRQAWVHETTVWKPVNIQSISF